MKLLKSTDIIRMTTSAASQIEVNASYGDYTPPSTLDLDRPNNAVVTTATTTTIIGSPSSGVKRNVKDISLRNNHATASCTVTIEHYDGTNAAEIYQVTLLPGETANFNETGQWLHTDATGAPYPPVGCGDYGGFSVPFLKTGTGADGVGYWYCSAKDGGFPGAWSPGTPGVNGRTTDGTDSADFGCIPIKNPATGANYLTETVIGGSLAHGHILFDVLWVNSGLSVTTTTEQTITTPTLPARDVNGSTNGEGLMIGLIVTTALSNGSGKADTTIRYTNSDGVANRVATLVAIAGSQFPASPVVGTLVWFNLQAGDKGVRSIEGITNVTTHTSGAFSLIIARWLEFVPSPIANIAGHKSGNTRLFNGTCMLHGYLGSAGTATSVHGNINVKEK